MASFSQKMNLANFTCRFGERFVLLDLFDEVVLPAFFNNYKRGYGDAQYFLIDVKLIKPASEEVAIAGRIVKNTKIGRDQVYKDGKIVSDHHEIESAPTSFFVLTLSNHKLLYVRENSGAPFISTFASTISSFLGQSYREWITQIYRAQKESDPSTTWHAITEEFPRPDLEVTPIASEGSLTAFVEKFRVINSLEIKLLPTNHELDNSAIFGEMRDVKDAIGAEAIVLKTQKKGDVGLDKGTVAQFIGGQAKEGNAKISITGTDVAGSKVKAENESFNVAVPIRQLPRDVYAAAHHLVQKLFEQVGAGFITLKDAPDTAISKVKSIIHRTNFE